MDDLSLEKWPSEVILALGVVAILLIGFAVYVSLPRPRFKERRRRRSNKADVQESRKASAALAAANDKGPPRDEFSPQESVLSRVELAFFGVLRQALPPQTQLFVQTALRAVVALRSDASRRPIEQNRLGQKSVEFLLCDQQTRPLLVIELDEAPVKNELRGKRDAFVDGALASAGIPVLHVPIADDYDVAQLRDRIAAAVATPRSSGVSVD